jgi:hypothetical protein
MPRDVPVALLINKWDRRQAAGARDGQARQQELDAFLQGHPDWPHATLVNQLRTSVPEGNFRAFAVSAFGEHGTKSLPDGRCIERPKTPTMLKSYGIEDSFAWVIQRRRAELQLARLEQKVSRLTVWRPWQVFGRDGPGRLKKEAAAFLTEGQQCERDRQRAEAVQRKSSRCLRLQVGLLVLLPLLLVGLVLGVEATADSLCFRSVQDTLGNPRSRPADLQDSESWLKDYCQAPWCRHLASRVFVLGREEARRELDRCRQVRAEKQKRQNEAAVSACEKELELLREPTNKDKRKLQQLTRRINSLPPHPEAETTELAHLLRQGKGLPDAEVGELTTRFRKQAVQILEESVKKLLQNLREAAPGRWYSTATSGWWARMRSPSPSAWRTRTGREPRPGPAGTALRSTARNCRASARVISIIVSLLWDRGREWARGGGPGSAAAQPVLLQPQALGLQGQRAPAERPQARATDRRQVGPPVPQGVGLHVAGAADGHRPQTRQVQLLAVQAAHRPPPVNDQLHGALRCAWAG